MTDNVKYSKGRNSVAVGLMLTFAVLVSFQPVLIAWSGIQRPFLFGAFWWTGEALALVLFLLIGYRRLFLNAKIWRVLWHRILGWAMLFWSVARFGFPVFAWSSSFIDVSVSATLYQLSPIMMILLTGRLFKRERRFRKVGAATILSFIAAVFGVAAVIASQGGGLSVLDEVSRLPTYALTLGVVLALSAAAIDSLIGFGFRWGVDTARDLPCDEGYSKDSLEIFSVVTGSLVCTLVSIPGIALIGVARNEPLIPTAMVIGLIGGAVVSASTGILWRKANLITGNLGINVIAYFAPLLSLGWLFALSLAGEVDPVLLLFGAVMIVGANISLVGCRESQDTQLRSLSVVALIRSYL